MTILGSVRFAFVRLTRPALRAAVPAPRLAPRRPGARPALLWFAAAVLALHGAAFVASSDTRVRDPEYGRRAAALRKRVAESPGRPLVLVLGSSRVAMGLRPAEWEATRPGDPARPDPMLFNMALIGSGPIMELMALRRIYADGFRPNVVLLEYWPPFLHQEGEWTEPHRVARDRLSDRDRQVVRDYFPHPVDVERDIEWRRRNPLFGNRERLLVQVLSRWLPPNRRTDWTWDDLDGWGWKPGTELEPGLGPVRADSHARCAEIYKPLFAAHRISPAVDRAFRESVSLARHHGAAVGLVYLPESSEFRRLYPPGVEAAVRTHLAALTAELSLPVINCREWVDDGFIVDGFHLSRAGAAEFTRKFGPAVAATFGAPPREPQVQVKP